MATGYVEYDYRGPEPAWDQNLVLPTLRRFIGTMPLGSRLLDLGCGNGALLATFAEAGWELVGVDASHSGITQARQHYPQVRFENADVCHDLTALFPPAYFDAIVAVEVVEHLYDPRRFVRNCWRLLKPAGTLVLTTPYHGYLKNIAIAVSGKSDHHYNPLWDCGHIKFWSKRTITTLLEEAGFNAFAFACRGRLPLLWKDMIVRARKPASDARD